MPYKTTLSNKNDTNTISRWVPLNTTQRHHIHYIINSRHNSKKQMTEFPFSRQGNSGLKKLNALPQLTWLVGAFLHKAWQGLVFRTWFCQDAMWFFNRQSGAVFWAKLFRRKTNLSTGRVSKSSQSFEIIKRRTVSNTAGWTILSLPHLNVELTSSLPSHSCVSREYTWNDNDFFFSPAFSLVPTWYRNSNQSILREGCYADSTQ